MTQPLPIDVSPISQPLPDPAHEAIRSSALKAIQTVWTNHLSLVDALTAAKADLAATQQQLAQAQADLTALTARVAALENPVPPIP